jgi:hypothetical protein
MRKVFSIWIGVVLVCNCLSGSALADFKDGLVGYWPFDETSGQVAHSLVPASGDGQLFNFPDDDSQWVPGQIGGALHFRGPSFQDYVIADHYPTATTALSFSGWVFADDNSVIWQSIFKNWGGATGQFHFGLRNNFKRLAVSVAQANTVSSGSAIDYTDPIFPSGQWVHVGFTVDTTLHGLIAYIKLYRNGQLVGIRPFDGTLRQDDGRGGKMSIGIGVKPNDAGTGADGGAPGYWQGSFDDFGLWSRVLSDDEMAQIYALGLNGQSWYTP